MKTKLNEIVEQLNRNSNKIIEMTSLNQLFTAELIILKRKGYITDEEIKNEFNTDSKNPEGNGPESERQQPSDERLINDESNKSNLPCNESTGTNELEEERLQNDNLPLSLNPSD